MTLPVSIIQEEQLLKLIELQLKHEISLVIEDVCVKACTEVESKIKEMADKLALKLLKEYEVSRLQESIVIKVKKV